MVESFVVIVVGKIWDLYVIEVLWVLFDENIDMIVDSVEFFVKLGCEVIYDVEYFFDGWKVNLDYVVKIVL